MDFFRFRSLEWTTNCEMGWVVGISKTSFWNFSEIFILQFYRKLQFFRSDEWIIGRPANSRIFLAFQIRKRTLKSSNSNKNCLQSVQTCIKTQNFSIFLFSIFKKLKFLRNTTTINNEFYGIFRKKTGKLKNVSVDFCFNLKNLEWWWNTSGKEIKIKKLRNERYTWEAKTCASWVNCFTNAYQEGSLLQPLNSSKKKLCKESCHLKITLHSFFIHQQTQRMNWLNTQFDTIRISAQKEAQVISGENIIIQKLWLRVNVNYFWKKNKFYQTFGCRINYCIAHFERTLEGIEMHHASFVHFTGLWECARRW